MICNEAELRVMLGLTSTISDDERAAINLILPGAESRIVEHLGYDPTQGVRTEYYPRNDPAGGEAISGGLWDVDASHRRAQLYAAGGAGPLYPTLQLQHIPVRAVVDLRVDYSARFGTATGAFASSSAWTSGTDYWPEWEQSSYCPSGCLFAAGTWPTEPGTVRVQYRAGYSSDELAGRATASGTGSDGTITTAGVNASAIKRAALITAVKAIQTWAALRKRSTVGFLPGAIQSERLGDYSYTLGASATGSIAGLVVALPAEAIDLLEPFVHWGRMRL